MPPEGASNFLRDGARRDAKCTKEPVGACSSQSPDDRLRLSGLGIFALGDRQSIVSGRTGPRRGLTC